MTPILAAVLALAPLEDVSPQPDRVELVDAKRSDFQVHIALRFTPTRDLRSVGLGCTLTDYRGNVVNVGGAELRDVVAGRGYTVWFKVVDHGRSSKISCGVHWSFPWRSP